MRRVREVYHAAKLIREMIKNKCPRAILKYRIHNFQIRKWIKSTGFDAEQRRRESFHARRFESECAQELLVPPWHKNFKDLYANMTQIPYGDTRAYERLMAGTIDEPVSWRTVAHHNNDISTGRKRKGRWVAQHLVFDRFKGVQYEIQMYANRLRHPKYTLGWEGQVIALPGKLPHDAIFSPPL